MCRQQVISPDESLKESDGREESGQGGAGCNGFAERFQLFSGLLLQSCCSYVLSSSIIFSVFATTPPSQSSSWGKLWRWYVNCNSHTLLLKLYLYNFPLHGLHLAPPGDLLVPSFQRAFCYMSLVRCTKLLVVGVATQNSHSHGWFIDTTPAINGDVGKFIFCFLHLTSPMNCLSHNVLHISQSPI